MGAIGKLWRKWLSGSLASTAPAHPDAVLPDGFEVRKLADTGVYVVENFCTPAEAQAIIDAALERLVRSGVMIDGKFQDSDERVSHTAQLFGEKYKHDSVVPLMYRAAALVGLPYTHLEDVYVTRYREGGYYQQHIDYGDAFGVDRLYTVLVYLNTVPKEQGGSTVFPTLKAAVQPVIGRAVSWTNKNPDGSGHLESNHAAYPIKNGGEKWAIQFWFHQYRMIAPFESGQDVGEGPRPLSGDEDLPNGVAALSRASG